jgi:hypothetical protein
VLFELFTGKKAQGGDPGTSMGTLDPAIEKAILNCLAPAPAARPSSAAAVARQMPGGGKGRPPARRERDALARDGRGRGRHGCLETVGRGRAVRCLHCGAHRGPDVVRAARPPFHPEDKSYGALRDRAQEFVRSLGPTSPKDDVRDGYSRTRATVHYWYRVSPTYVPPMASDNRVVSLFAAPALETPGEKALRFDVQGRLLEYRALPADSGTATGYVPFFRAAVLEGVARVPAEATLVLQSPADAESAWTIDGHHVEGRTHKGQVTAFVIDRSEVPSSDRASGHRAGFHRTGVYGRHPDHGAHSRGAQSAPGARGRSRRGSGDPIYDGVLVLRVRRPGLTSARALPGVLAGSASRSRSCSACSPPRATLASSRSSGAASRNGSPHGRGFSRDDGSIPGWAGTF